MIRSAFGFSRMPPRISSRDKAAQSALTRSSTGITGNSPGSVSVSPPVSLRPIYSVLVPTGTSETASRLTSLNQALPVFSEPYPPRRMAAVASF